MIPRLGGFTINRIPRSEPAAYPTLCKGRFVAGKASGYIFEEPVSLNAGELLPGLAKAGVTARAYIAAVVNAFRQAVDAMAEGHSVDLDRLLALAEGQSSTQGAYAKTWR